MAMMIKLPDDCTVRLIDLPLKVGGMLSESPDGHLNIYLNARLDIVSQRQWLRHEIEHVNRDDLHNDVPIIAVERHQAPVQQPCSQPEEIPAPPPEAAHSAPQPRQRLSAYQTRVLLQAVADLDDWYDRERFKALSWYE